MRKSTKSGLRVFVFTLLALLVLYVVANRIVIGNILARRDAGILAHDLVTRTNSKHLIQVPAEFQEKLSTFLASTGKLSRVTKGDVPTDRGTREAEWCIWLTNAAAELLVVRLKEAGEGKFEYMGFVEPPRPH